MRVGEKKSYITLALSLCAFICILDARDVYSTNTKVMRQQKPKLTRRSKTGACPCGPPTKRPKEPLWKQDFTSDRIVLEVVIDEEGNVQTARSIAGNPKLEQEAIQEVKKLKFAPGEISGKRVKTIGTIEYPFKKKGGAVP
jgi:hypothetical protein